MYDDDDDEESASEGQLCDTCMTWMSPGENPCARCGNER
jgi:uncharacterized OB-fold protein